MSIEIIHPPHVEDLIEALKEANYHLEKNIPDYNRYNPKYWSMTKVMMKFNIKVRRP